MKHLIIIFTLLFTFTMFSSSASAACTYTVTANDGLTVSAAGGTLTFAVATQAGCAWTSSVTSNAFDNGVRIASESSGVGNGTVILAARDKLPSGAQAQRTGVITVAGQDFAFSQNLPTRCVFTIAPVPEFSAAGGPLNLVVTKNNPNCDLRFAFGGVSWVSETRIVSPNYGPARSGAVYFRHQQYVESTNYFYNPQPVPVSQVGNCSIFFSKNSQSFGVQGGVFTAYIDNSHHECGFGTTPVSSVDWIKVGESYGGTSRDYTVAPNAGAPRTGFITSQTDKGTNTITVTQAGCDYSISPSSTTELPAAGDGGTFSLQTECGWTALSNSDWITLSSAASGTGNAAISFAAAANTTGAARSGTITVGGQTFTVNQAPGTAKRKRIRVF